MKRVVSLMLSLLLICCSCGKTNEATEQFFSMDTVMTMKADGQNAADALLLAKQKIYELEGLFSVTREDSEIYALNRDGRAELSYDTQKIIERALEMKDMTGGAFDIMLRPVSKLWGFTEGTPRIPGKDELYAAVQKYKSSTLTVSGSAAICSGEIDLGGIAKGYAASCVRDILTQNGVESAVVSLGGNVMLRGARKDGSPWQVGIAHPKKKDELIGVLQAEDCAVVTSGGYERSFEQNGVTYHHIIDPETGYPSQSGIISATVVAADDTMADALSTALFVMGKERAESLWRTVGGFEMILITDSEIIVTDGLDFSPQDNAFSVCKLEK